MSNTQEIIVAKNLQFNNKEFLKKNI